MNILTLSILILNLFIIISILTQEDNIKNTGLAFGRNQLFESFIEKLTFIAIIFQFVLLLVNIKIDFL